MDGSERAIIQQEACTPEGMNEHPSTSHFITTALLVATAVFRETIKIQKDRQKCNKVG